MEEVARPYRAGELSVRCSLARHAASRVRGRTVEGTYRVGPRPEAPGDRRADGGGMVHCLAAVNEGGDVALTSLS